MTPEQLRKLADKHRGETITLFEAWQQETPAKHYYEPIETTEKMFHFFCDICDSNEFLRRSDALKLGWTFALGQEFCPKHLD
jgi:hypothetical protein